MLQLPRFFGYVLQPHRETVWRSRQGIVNTSSRVVALSKTTRSSSLLDIGGILISSMEVSTTSTCETSFRLIHLSFSKEQVGWKQLMWTFLHSNCWTVYRPSKCWVPWSSTQLVQPVCGALLTNVQWTRGDIQDKPQDHPSELGRRDEIYVLLYAMTSGGQRLLKWRRLCFTAVLLSIESHWLMESSGVKDIL